MLLPVCFRFSSFPISPDCPTGDGAVDTKFAWLNISSTGLEWNFRQLFATGVLDRIGDEEFGGR